MGRSTGVPSVRVTVSVRSECNVSTRRSRCTRRWWNQHSLTRLRSRVGPPFNRSMTWWASNAPAWLQPGNWHVAWRRASQRRCPTEGDTLRSTSTGPFGYSSTVVTDPSQAIASAISGAMAGPWSRWALPSASTWAITCAGVWPPPHTRSTSVSAALVAHR